MNKNGKGFRPCRFILWMRGWILIFCLFGMCRGLRMTHTIHRTSGATAAATGFALFLVADHFQDDRKTDEKYAECNENGGEILNNPIENDHGVTPF